MENILLKKAIEYAERGWYVFPTREKLGKPFKNEKGKEVQIPLKAPYTKGGFKAATTDVEQIKQWWIKYPNAGIGVDCGRSNLVVIDIDVRNGKPGLDSFMKLGISDDGALHAVTPSGGLHVVFSGSMNSHADIKSGVDIRGIGAYFLVPPSWIYEDGQRRKYVEVDDWSRTPAHYPSSLEEQIAKLRGNYSKERKQEKTVVIENPDKTIKRAQRALEQLPQYFCEDYFKWVNVGMSLKCLGDAGFELWDKWSQKSEKYDRDALEYRWDNFSPRDIGLGSLFFYAKEAQRAKQ